MPHLTPAPSSFRTLRSALSDYGLRVREESDELIHTERDFELRILLPERRGGHALRCFISVAETRLNSGAIVLFNDIALEGYPAVAYGAGRGQVVFEFDWFHPEGADWRISAQRCQGLVERVVGALVPIAPRSEGKFAVRRSQPALLSAMLSGCLAPAG